jgi:hypothetical protein
MGLFSLIAINPDVNAWAREITSGDGGFTAE